MVATAATHNSVEAEHQQGPLTISVAAPSEEELADMVVEAAVTEVAAGPPQKDPRPPTVKEICTSSFLITLRRQARRRSVPRRLEGGVLTAPVCTYSVTVLYEDLLYNSLSTLIVSQSVTRTSSFWIGIATLLIRNMAKEGV